LQTLTQEKDQLTTDKSNLETQLAEKDNIINDTTIPTLIAQLDQYASKIANPELKTTLAEIQNSLARLQNTDLLAATNSKIEELKNQIEKAQQSKKTD